MGRNRESAEVREEKQIQNEEKAEKKKKDKEKKDQRRGERRLKKQEKKIKSSPEIKESNCEIISEILNDNPILRQKKIICFDLYGTLIYRPHSHGKVKHFLKNVGIKPFKKYYDIIQTHRKEDVNTAYESVDGFKMPNRAIRKLQEHTDEEVKNTRIYTETLAVLKKLKKSGYKLALISNLSQDFEIPLRKLIPDDIFDYEALSYDVGAMKPDEKIFNKILKEAKLGEKDSNIDMNDMLMIGDSKKSDVDGAKNVGMDAILLKREPEKSKKDKKTEGLPENIVYDKERQLIIVHTLADLLDILGIEY